MRGLWSVAPRNLSVGAVWLIASYKRAKEFVNSTEVPTGHVKWDWPNSVPCSTAFRYCMNEKKFPYHVYLNSEI